MKAGTTTTATDPAFPRFHFIGGKGGVGKTTCAAALSLAEAATGARVLVASTDPAPSLGDALTVSLAAAPRRIPLATGKLWAVEIDAATSLRRWLADRRATLEKIAVDGTWLDHDDVARLLRLSLPGIDELAALLEIDRLGRGRRYDTIIVDTAPTGHTLRMLTMPATLRGLAVVFDRMRQKHRVMEEALRGAWRPAAEDALIDELAGTADDLSSLLRTRERTRLSWVTLAEPLAIAECMAAVGALGDAGIEVGTIIANRLTPAPPSPCGHCDARLAFEGRALKGLGAATVIGVQARDVEPRGRRALAAIAAELTRRKPPRETAARRRTWTSTAAGPRSAGPRSAGPRSAGTRVRAWETVPDSARLVLFGGKGGVGKTTCAAATAVSTAAHRRDRRVLLISTDPAHSLADVLGAAVSDTPRRVKGGPANLDVREIDPALILARFQQRYSETIDRMFDRMAGGGSFDAAHDRSIMKGLIDLAPPGLDELTAVLEITEAISSERPEWDLVIMDTAPTGHALRLLEMPSLIQDWARALMAILLKYQGVARVGEFGETLVRLSRGIGRLRELLSAPEQTIFIAVTRAAALPRLETARLLDRLDALGVHVPSIVVNAIGRGECRRCKRIKVAERRELEAIRKLIAKRSSVRMIVAGLAIPPPSTPASLRRWGNSAWRSTPGYHQDR